ncbi:MAG TPA: hypothetical protein VJY62_08715, partial [Bacteroidia bacterium]|nr:hypothetical protein [Bacteroidia bacterium]
MKKAEKILGSIAFMGLILKLSLIPGGGILISLSLLTLAFLYYFSFAFLNDIPLKNIFKKESYNGISPLKMIGTAGIGIALAQCTLGLLFKIQNYEGYT